MSTQAGRSFVALGGAVADELIYFNARVLGATQDARAIAGRLPINPDVESVRTLGPDLVIADLGTVSMDTVTALRDGGLEVETVQATSIKRTAGMIRQLGTFTGNKAEATQIANALEGELNDRLDRLAYAIRPVVLPLSWPEPLTGAGPGTLISDVLWTSGLANALSGYEEPWPELDTSLYLGADVVLGLPFFDDWGAFAHLGAMGEQGQLISVHPNTTMRGRQVFMAVDALIPQVRQIHQLIA